MEASIQQLMEASIQDLTRTLGPREVRAAYLFDHALLEVDLEVAYGPPAGVLDDLAHAWFVDDDGVVVTTTDDVVQLDRSSRFHTTCLAVALLAAALGTLTF